MTTPETNAAKLLGRKGGQARTDSKRRASRENGKRGGRPEEKTVKLTNCFHNTSIRISREWGETPDEAWTNLLAAEHREINGREYGPARRLLAKIRRTLCGADDCRCGCFRPQ